MAMLPGRACRHPGCPEIVTGDKEYCAEHEWLARQKHNKETDAKRGSARQRGYDRKWETFRQWFFNRAGNQYCHRCLALKGEIIKATLIHHIIPIKERPDLRLVPENCQPLCFDCHEELHGRKKPANP